MKYNFISGKKNIRNVVTCILDTHTQKVATY